MILIRLTVDRVDYTFEDYLKTLSLIIAKRKEEISLVLSLFNSGLLTVRETSGQISSVCKHYSKGEIEIFIECCTKFDMSSTVLRGVIESHDKIKTYES